MQSEILQDQNQELEAKTTALEEQKKQIELAKQEVEENAKRVEEASRYKSEFLANMSHELRTPLNSLLILSRAFADNEDGNLNEDQVEAGKIIHGGGTELLNLINDLLDLSKVEAGQLDFYFSKVPISGLVSSVSRIVKPMIQQKGLEFIVDVASDLPEDIVTDPKRVEQILKNLLSNASKFTHEGSITIKVENLGEDEKVSSPELQANDCVSFSVIDTGIGIPEDKQEAIFEAFKQADGTTTREYGGTGLGLSISREFSQLLHGEMHLKSKAGEGSCFTLVLPVKPVGEEIAESSSSKSYPSQSFTNESTVAQESTAEKESAEKLTPLEPIQKYLEDDRDQLEPNKTTILIIEDDRVFANLILKRTRAMGYQVVAVSNASNGLYMAKKIKPAGILLDMGLPDTTGDVLIDHLHEIEGLEKVPVYILSARDWIDDNVLEKTVGFLRKPVTSEQLDHLLGDFKPSDTSKILINQKSAEDQKELESLFTSFKSNIQTSQSLEEAVSLMNSEKYDLFVTDIEPEDPALNQLSEFIEKTDKARLPKVVIYSQKITNNEELKKLENITTSIIFKGAESQTRLMDDISMFFHDIKPGESLHEKPAKTPTKTNVELGSAVLKDKRVLLVDDDIRNTFAIGKLLKKEGLKVVMADNGDAAIKKLKSAEEPFDIVLMDMMMPIMDGYEAMEKIREERKYKKLPIIALTAKAMPEDRQKCIDSGANDYLSKPVNTEKLLSLMRVWVS